MGCIEKKCTGCTGWDRIGRLTNHTLDTRHIHNTPLTLHGPQLRPEAIHQAREINAYNPLPLLVLQLSQFRDTMLLPDDARAVRGAVELAVLGDNRGDPGVDRGDGCHV